MASLLRNRITLVWTGLVLATLFSWETLGSFADAADLRLLGAAVFAIAFLKSRYIMLEFMELRHAPLPLRLLAESWTVLICAGVILFYWGGGSAA